ncbi:MAG TPA: hypothetical protein DCX25_02615 [Candidatus Pacebacteria bacterium]|nr:hypothetical protein [Candidatus Paceibacterota bacterium]HCR11092.1 hypothetical protein [Candidatus Paceibacterota bacterium]HCR93225.1 hypothetical protein [Candidatus Paceibacterota bacterium]
MKKHMFTLKNTTTASLFLGILLTSFTIVAAKTPVMTKYTAGVVLGDEFEQKTEKTNEETKKSEERSREQQKQETSSGTSNTSVNVQREGTKQELEIQTGNRKVKTKAEDNGKFKLEIENPDVKLKYEVKDGELLLKTEDKKGNEKEASEQEKEETEGLFEQEDIEVASKEGEIEFEHKGVRTRTNFPLSIDPTTNGLVVTTPAGQKTVTTLPDVAVQNMLSQGVLTTIVSESVQTSPVQLETFEGELAYRIEGEKEIRVLGFIPVMVQTTAYVSPDDGQIVAQRRSLLSNILNFISTK